MSWVFQTFSATLQDTGLIHGHDPNDDLTSGFWNLSKNEHPTQVMSPMIAEVLFFSQSIDFSIVKKFVNRGSPNPPEIHPRGQGIRLPRALTVWNDRPDSESFLLSYS